MIVLDQPEGPADEIYCGPCVHCGEPDIWTIQVTCGGVAPQWYAGHYHGDLDEACGAATALRPTREAAATLWCRRAKAGPDMDWIIDVVQEAIGDMGCPNPKREHFTQAMFEVIANFERRWPEVALTDEERSR